MAAPARRAGELFPRHDLIHYAVETVLGHRRGFYGLAAGGWDLTDFGTPWPSGPIPADAERASGAEWTAEDLTEQAAPFYAANGFAGAPPVITHAQLARIRARMRELFARCDAVAPGKTLELIFEPPVLRG